MKKLKKILSMVGFILIAIGFIYMASGVAEIDDPNIIFPTMKSLGIALAFIVAGVVVLYKSNP